MLVAARCCNQHHHPLPQTTSTSPPSTTTNINITTFYHNQPAPHQHRIRSLSYLCSSPFHHQSYSLPHRSLINATKICLAIPGKCRRTTLHLVLRRRTRILRTCKPNLRMCRSTILRAMAPEIRHPRPAGRFPLASKAWRGRSPFVFRGTQDTVIISRPQTPAHGTSVNPSTFTPPNSSTVHAGLSPSHSTVAISAASGIRNVDCTDTGNIRDEVAALPSIRRLPAQKAIAQQTGVSRPVRKVPRTTENRDLNPAWLGAQAAAVDYAITENMSEVTGEQFSSRTSFTSSFSRVPDCQRRELCDRRVEKRPRLRGLTLDDTRLGTVNEWTTTAVDGMALTRYVLKPDVFNRRDVHRIRTLFDKDPNYRDIWSRKKQQREWFEIPATLRCDRTFARDPLECYYLERLDELLRTDRFDEARENSPLLPDPLVLRWWCASRLR